MRRLIISSVFLAGALALGVFVGGLFAVESDLLPRFALKNGDVNGDLERDLSDGVYLLSHLFLGTPAPVPLANCAGWAPDVQNGDTNGDGERDVSDPIHLLRWLYFGEADPAPECASFLDAFGGGGAKNPNPRVIPVGAKAHGQTYGDWGAAWWRWALGIAKDVNPVTDPSGEHCDEGQSGSVWFLAGTFGGNVERSCTVPAGKTIFFPLLNYVLWTPEDLAFVDSIGVPGATTEEKFRTAMDAFLDNATTLTCTVDGVALNDLFSYRASSSTGTTPLLLGPDNVLQDFGYPDGLREESVTDGYWLMLAPLPEGEHTIVFSSELVCTAAECFGLDFAFGVTVTYHLTVEG
ncbi:MAG: hypothetical protein HY725_21910 [Candidatus Rokubacteria bacterium]|nr:hypothetical protein [Candidatus Rokubacteria bacterium]